MLLEAILELKCLGKREKLNIKLQKQIQDSIPAQIVPAQIAPAQTQAPIQAQEQNKPKTHAEILQTGLQGKNSQDIRLKTL